MAIGEQGIDQGGPQEKRAAETENAFGGDRRPGGKQAGTCGSRGDAGGVLEEVSTVHRGVPLRR